VIDVRLLRSPDRSSWETLFRAYMHFYGRDEPQALYDRAWQEFMRDDRMHALVACIDSRVIGIAHFLIHANTSAADVCYLQDLFTAQDFRGQGVGKALIEAVVEQARQRKCSRVYWMTQETNTTARSLYDRVAQYRGFIRYQIQLDSPPTTSTLPGVVGPRIGVTRDARGMRVRSERSPDKT
jgi:GNAT superfamily N-acetyltransferase